MRELFLSKLRLSTVDYVASNNKSHGGCLLNCAVVIHHALELISGSVNGGEICMVPSSNLTNILIIFKQHTVEPGY